MVPAAVPVSHTQVQPLVVLSEVYQAAFQDTLEEVSEFTQEVSSPVFKEEAAWEAVSEAASGAAQRELDRVLEAKVPALELVDTKALMEATPVEADSVVNFTAPLSMAMLLATGSILATAPLAVSMVTDSHHNTDTTQCMAVHSAPVTASEAAASGNLPVVNAPCLPEGLPLGAPGLPHRVHRPPVPAVSDRGCR